MLRNALHNFDEQAFNLGVGHVVIPKFDKRNEACGRET